MTLPSVELSAPREPPAPPPAKAGAKESKAPAKGAEPSAAPAPAAAAPQAPDPAPAPAVAAVAPPAPSVLQVAVFPLDAPSDLVLLGRSLADAIAQEAAKMAGLQVLAPAAVVAKLGADGAAQVSHCGEAAGCYAAPAAQMGVDRVVGGWIDRVGTSYRFGLVFVDAKGGKPLARVQREVPIASRRLRSDVIAAAGPLLRGEAAVTGTLAVLTEIPGADVRIDDKSAGRTPLEARLPAGKHKVEVAQRGKVRVEPFWVDVPANGRTEQRVRLFDIPVAERKPGEIETVVDVGKDKKRKR